MVPVVPLLSVFVLCYLGITIEHLLHVNKSAIALFGAFVTWAIVYIYSPELASHSHESLGEIAGIVFFLACAMLLVEILNARKLFDAIRVKLFSMGLDDRKQALIIWVCTFFLSALLDNMAVTLVMLAIAVLFFTGRNLLITAAGIVVMANAGGAWSPIGDVTTVMLWLAGKFTAFEIVRLTFVPSAVQGLVSGYFLYRQIAVGNTKDVKAEEINLHWMDIIIIVVTLAGFLMSLVAMQMGLPPAVGLFATAGLVWLVTDIHHKWGNGNAPVRKQVRELLEEIDMDSLLFFAGILLMVGALEVSGVLETLSHQIFGETPSMSRMLIGNYFMGIFSAVVDNVPLTAVGIDMIPSTDPVVWANLAYAVGTGGSLLSIGSVSGVVMLGMILKRSKEQNEDGEYDVQPMTFMTYVQIATFPVFAGYTAGFIISAVTALM